MFALHQEKHDFNGSIYTCFSSDFWAPLVNHTYTWARLNITKETHNKERVWQRWEKKNGGGGGNPLFPVLRTVTDLPWFPCYLCERCLRLPFISWSDNDNGWKSDRCEQTRFFFKLTKWWTTKNVFRDQEQFIKSLFVWKPMRGCIMSLWPTSDVQL